jgi:predicted ATP-grasp superfamily ATP-dependent carboligase
MPVLNVKGEDPRYGHSFVSLDINDIFKVVIPANLNRYPVIVTDGLWRKSLSAIRALGKAGFEVHVFGGSIFTTGFWSSYASSHQIAPSAAENPEKFGEALLAYLKRFPKDRPPVLLPMEDATLLWVSQNRALLEGKARFAIPTEEAITLAEDKNLTIAQAEKIGVPVPQTWRPGNARELFTLLEKMGGRGWVIKPCTGSGSSGIIYGPLLPAFDFIERHWQRYGALLLQERIPADGRGIGDSVLMDGRGRDLARFSHERLKQYPVSGGPSTDRQSIHHPKLEEYSLALLKGLNWNGIAMVEWKADPRDGSFKLMEINPRFWGSLELAVRSGVDFPVLYARHALGEAPSSLPAYRDGVRCRWLVPGEILRYLGTRASEREGLLRFFSGLPALAEEWDWRDLRGTFATLICTAALALNPKYWKFLRRG